MKYLSVIYGELRETHGECTIAVAVSWLQPGEEWTKVEVFQ